MKKYIIAILTISLLTFTYYTNWFNLVTDNNFQTFDECDEINVTARLALSDKSGLFSQSMFNGWFFDSSEIINIKNRYIEQKNIYLGYKEGFEKNYVPYLSQPGGQSFLFGILAKISPFSKENNLRIFQFINCLLLSIALTIILKWILNHFGRATAVVSFIFLIFSTTLTLYAKSLWWSLWSFYIPFISVLLLYSHNSSIKKYKIFIIMFSSMLIKIWLTGFEFITPTIFMCFVPIFFYFIMNNWSYRYLFSHLITVSVGFFLSIFIGLSILVFQIYFLTGKLSNGLKHIEFSFLKRTHGDPKNLDSSYSESLNSNLIDVLSFYINKPVFTLNIEKYYKKFFLATENIPFFDFLFYWRFKFLNLLFNVTYLDLFIVVILYGIYLLFRNFTKRNKALFLMLVFSMASIFSWFVIFKAHSYIHKWLDEIVFYFPFMIICSIYFGILIKQIIYFFKKISVLSRI